MVHSSWFIAGEESRSNHELSTMNYELSDQ
jgi:hypothetical protein